MALKATIHKATLNIADMDRHYYADHHLTVAQHPSETRLCPERQRDPGIHQGAEHR